MSARTIERAAKRRKVQQNGGVEEVEPPAPSDHVGAYKAGAIRRVVLHNFVTFDHVDFRLGPCVLPSLSLSLSPSTHPC